MYEITAMPSLEHASYSEQADRCDADAWATRVTLKDVRAFSSGGGALRSACRDKILLASSR